MTPLPPNILFRRTCLPRYRGSTVHRGLWGLAFALTACLVPDPNHCANRDGDATCAELGMGQYCSACAATNFGCQQQVPEDACYPGTGGATMPTTGPTTTDESGTEAEAESGSSSGPPPDCMGDDECPEGNPYCIDGTCGTCDQAAEGFCGDLDAGTPVCHEAWGRCVQCTELQDEACGEENPWCGPDFTCGGCYDHDQCPTSACDMSRGNCLPDNNVWYVDNDACAGGTMAGTSSDPFCTIPEAMGAVGAGGRGTIFVRRGSTYSDGILTQNSRTVAIIGQQEPVIIASTGEGAQVSAGDRLFIADAIVRSAGDIGLRCDGNSQLWLDNVHTDNNRVGIVASSCQLRVHASEIVYNDEAGIELGAGGEMLMTSTAMVNNSREGSFPTIDSDGGTFDIRYSTIVGIGAPTIRCAGGTGGPVHNSVVVSPELESVDCVWAEFDHSVHDGGVGEFTGDGNALIGAFDEDWFVMLDGSDVHVRGPGSSPFAGVAVWEPGDPLRDLDNERRDATPGASGFAGADEP